MAFKVKTVKIDIDLDMSDVAGIKETEKLLKPVKITTVENIMDWGNRVKALKPEGANTEEEATRLLMKKYDGDIKKVAAEMAEAIDFWYGKGVDWWMNTLDEVALIIQIFSFLVGEFFKQKKKIVFFETIAFFKEHNFSIAEVERLLNDYGWAWLNDFAYYLGAKKSKSDAQLQLLITEAVFNGNVPIHSKKGHGIYKKYFAKKMRLIRSFFAEKPVSLHAKLLARKKKRKEQKS